MCLPRFCWVIMVLDRIKHRATEYLHSKGLTNEDVGKVIGIFFFAKYITFVSMIPICYRYQPLRRFLQPSNMVKAKEYFAARRNTFQQSRAGQQMRTRAKSYQDWLKKHNIDRKTENFNLAGVKRRLNQFMHTKRDQFQQRKQKLLDNKPTEGWKARLFNFTERMANKAAANKRWQNLAQNLHVPPKQLTYAIGEGLVMYKLLSPVWMPLELFGIVKFLQWRHRVKDGMIALSEKPK